MIKALEQEQCDNCISRQAVLNKINEVCFSEEKEWIDFRVSWGSNGQRDLIIEFIESLPSVTPKQKIGHWIDRGTCEPWYTCSECGRLGWCKEYYFCPNCGAKMRSNDK